MVLGRKVGNRKLISSENLFFFFRNHHDFRPFFCPIRNLLENHDLGKRHKIWAKLHCRFAARRL